MLLHRSTLRRALERRTDARAARRGAWRAELGDTQFLKLIVVLTYSRGRRATTRKGVKQKNI